MVRREEVVSTAQALAATITEAPADALRFTKARMAGGGGADLEASFVAGHDRAFREIILAPGRWAAAPDASAPRGGGRDA